MKTFGSALAFALVVLAPSLAPAADFGGQEEAPPAAAFVMTPPVLFARPYNDVYEDRNGVYYAPPYSLPYFGLFPQWGPEVAFYPQPGWIAPPPPPRVRFRRHY